MWQPHKALIVIKVFWRLASSSAGASLISVGSYTAASMLRRHCCSSRRLQGSARASKDGSTRTSSKDGSGKPSKEAGAKPSKQQGSGERQSTSQRTMKAPAKTKKDLDRK